MPADAEAGGSEFEGLSSEGLHTVRIEERQDRLLLTLHRPEVRNAIDARMAAELNTVCTHLESTPKVLIITGLPADPASGRKAVFASGADISQMLGRRRDDALAGINSTVFDRIARLPMPVIAALDGHVLGGGAELAYAADFRLGTAAVRLGNPEPGLGILAAAGATWRLRDLVGEPLAKEILLAQRILTGQECLEAGLLTSLVEPERLLEEAHALTDRIGRGDPVAVRLAKAVFHTPRQAHPLIDTLAQALLFESPAKHERMQQFLDRKKR